MIAVPSALDLAGSLLREADMRKARTSTLLLLTFGLAAVASAQQPMGFQPGQRLEGFKPIDDYVLSLGGEEAKEARIYSNPTPAILVVAKELGAPVVLWPRTRAVESINTMKLAKGDAGGLDIYPDPVVATHPPFAVEGLEVRFSVDGNDAVLRPRPDVVGLHGAASLRQESAKYADRADYYEPSEELLAKLRGDGRAVRVRVFFGTWCPACGQQVPKIMKVAEQLEGSSVAFEFYGLPKGFSGEPEAEAYDVHSVPTGVVFVEGQEAGRIAGIEWRSPEGAIDKILGGS